jgi:hypothetical protein
VKNPDKKIDWINAGIYCLYRELIATLLAIPVDTSLLNAS